jgi:transcriptional regulator with XRE-family HTH domain
MNESAKLGNNLKRIREAKKMSQGDVMCGMGCSRSYVSNIENGKTNPTLETISKLAKVLDVSTTELLK